jgi:hypothetical protein
MSHESHASQTTSWVTPRWVFDWLGKFDLDPATFDGHPWPCATENRTSGGLDAPWHGRVFLNPPFTNGQIEPIVKRMAEHGNGVLVVAARVETAWFQDYVAGAARAIWFPRKRVQFCDQTGQAITRCGFPSCVAFYETPTLPAPREGRWWMPQFIPRKTA